MPTRAKTAAKKTVAKKAASTPKTITITKKEYELLQTCQNAVLYYFKKEHGSYSMCSPWARRFPKLQAWLNEKRIEVEREKAKKLVSKYSDKVKAACKDAKTPEQLTEALLTNKELLYSMYYSR